MKTQASFDYDRISKAIDFIKQNFRKQPSLDEIAAHINLSPFDFQHLFTEWAGTSPKQFIAYLSLEYAKTVLKKKTKSFFDVAQEKGLTCSGTLHDLFVTIEGMTPSDFRNGGENLKINFSFSECRFGRSLIASTKKGICFLAFTENDETTIAELKGTFPNATYIFQKDDIQEKAISIFEKNETPSEDIRLHLKGTDFQIKVWNALLQIPLGSLSSYGDVADAICSPKAARAVGTAIGDNPIAFIIPCHRVIENTGNYGEYRWGRTRKSALIGWEAATIMT